MSTRDQILAAQLHGAASRLGGWTAPKDKARDAAIAQLREIACASRDPRGTITAVRSDLLARVAGLLLGSDPPGTTHFQRSRNAAELLIEAGADQDQIDLWIDEGETRRAMPLPGQRPG